MSTYALAGFGGPAFVPPIEKLGTSNGYLAGRASRSPAGAKVGLITIIIFDLGLGYDYNKLIHLK